MKLYFLADEAVLSLCQARAHFSLLTKLLANDLELIAPVPVVTYRIPGDTEYTAAVVQIDLSAQGGDREQAMAHLHDVIVDRWRFLHGKPVKSLSLPLVELREALREYIRFTSV